MNGLHQQPKPLQTRIPFELWLTLLPCAAGFFIRTNLTDSPDLTALIQPIWQWWIPVSSMILILLLYWFLPRTIPEKIRNLLLESLCIASLASSAIMAAVQLQIRFDVLGLVTFLTGVLLAVLGNVMPKVERNAMFGVRTHWSLASQDNWDYTNRQAGRLFFWCGITCMFVSVFPFGFLVMIGLVLLVSGLSEWISYAFYKEQLKTGAVLADDPKYQMDADEKRSVKIILMFAGIMCTLAAGFAAWIFLGADCTIQAQTDALQIEASFVSDLRIPYDDNESVSLEDQLPSGTKVYGYNGFGLDMGKFENSEFGTYQRYTRDFDCCIILHTTKGVVVLNDECPKKTQELYEQIQSHLPSASSFGCLPYALAFCRIF